MKGLTGVRCGGAVRIGWWWWWWWWWWSRRSVWNIAQLGHPSSLHATPPLLVVGRALTVASPAQPSFLRGVRVPSPILWKCPHHHPCGRSMFAPPQLGVGPMPHPQNSAFRGGKQGVKPYPVPNLIEPSPQNNTVTLVGLYFLLPRASAPSLGGSLAWGARNL